MSRPKNSKNKNSKINPIPEVPKRRCLHCGEEKQDEHFYKLHNNSDIYIGNDNYLPICKECVKILYEQYKVSYINQFVVLDAEKNEHEIQKLAIRRLCMTFDIYYSDRLFDVALKQIERFPTLDMVCAYMKIANLKQSKNKSYDDTITERFEKELECLKQEQGKDLSWMGDAI